MKKQLLSSILGASLAGFGLVGTLPQPAQACNILLSGIRCAPDVIRSIPDTVAPIFSGGSSGGGGMGGRSPDVEPEYSQEDLDQLGEDSGIIYSPDDRRNGISSDPISDDTDDSLVLPPSSHGSWLTGPQGIYSITDFHFVHGRMPTIGEALNIPGHYPLGGGCVRSRNSGETTCGLK